MTRSERFLDELQDGVLIGDGATGTELFARGATPDKGIERLNLLAPDQVLRLHRDYVAAGSRVIETNTFSANRISLARYQAEEQVREIALAGVRLAREAATADVYVAGSIGPLPDVDGEPLGHRECAACYSEQIAALLEGGVDLLIFESFNDLDELLGAIAAARSLTDLSIVAQMAFQRGGHTSNDVSASEVAARCREAGAQVVGANCGYGVSSVADAITEMAPLGLPMSAYLNAGFPEEVEGRLLYLATPEYLVRRAKDLVDLGVRLVGGCCGTGPDTIRSIVQAIPQRKRSQYPLRAPETPIRAYLHPGEPPAPDSASASFPILVELDPPTNLDVAPILESARTLKNAGVTALTVADNPLASVRVDTLTVAGLLQREVGLPVIPHLTGRDRNRIALQSTIMGAQVLDIHALLCVTGDPIRFCQDPNTSGVFDVTSVGLVKLVAEFNAGRRMHGGTRTALSIGVALNPNVRTLSGQIDKLQRKIEAGAHFALTQPIFEEERLDLLQQALADAGIDIPVHIGVMPLSSLRNADFLHNEVPGMRIPDEVRARLARYESVEDQRAAGIEIAVESVQRFASRVHGLYLIAPRNRMDMILPLIETARSMATTV